MTSHIEFRAATAEDAGKISTLICALTREITQATGAELIDDVQQVTTTCKELMNAGHYAGLLAKVEQEVVAVVTYTETYALYAGGKMGLIQEFYVCPEFRSKNIGADLITKLKALGKQKEWACIELCTPPLPEFERTLAFYQKNGLSPVGGRKMREMLG